MKIVLLLLALIASSCLRSPYEEILLEYFPPVAGDVASNTFTVAASDRLIVTISGGTFQEILDAADFEFTQGQTDIPFDSLQRDSDTRVIFSFDTPFSGSNYKILVKRTAFINAASRVTVQAVKSGIWSVASGAETALGRSMIWDMAYGNGRFVAVADDGRMAHSGDGSAWSAIHPGNVGNQSKFTNTIRGIAYGNGKFIAVGYDARMASSDNGISWNGWTESIFDGQSILCVTYGGGRFVAAGDGGRMINMPDSGNWNRVENTTFAGKSILALAWGNPDGQNVYVAAGVDGHIAWSNDAWNWQAASTNPLGEGANRIINGLAWGNGIFVAVDNDGRIARSVNGREWSFGGNSESAFGGTGTLSVSFGNGLFIAVGHNGKMASSGNGINWTMIDPDSGHQFDNEWEIHTVGYGGGRFIAAGISYPPYPEPEWFERTNRIVYSWQ